MFSVPVTGGDAPGWSAGAGTRVATGGVGIVDADAVDADAEADGEEGRTDGDVAGALFEVASVSPLETGCW